MIHRFRAAAQVDEPVRLPYTFPMRSRTEVAAKAFLLHTQNADGGWGYAVGHASNVEATAAAALALAGDVATGVPSPPALLAPALLAPAPLAPQLWGERGADRGAEQAADRAADWLVAAQRRDGGWGLVADDPVSGWQTAWAVLALARLGADEAVLRRGLAWLLAVQLVRIEKAEDVRWMKDILGIDPTLRGWPWLPGQAGWVEPTALALLALAPWAAREDVRPRLDEGVRFLLDRRCGGGGWNVGNPMMFSRPLPARAIPTAWALLALARVAPDAVREEDVATLRREMDGDRSTSALAWGLLALRSLGQDDRGAADLLMARQAADGGWDNSPYHTAVALRALG
jgi:hypothetical protein